MAAGRTSKEERRLVGPAARSVADADVLQRPGL